MKLHELLEQYSALSKKQMMLFLSALAAELTVRARATYIPNSDGVENPQRLREFNELQHRVTAHVRDLISDRRERFPDAVICQIIWQGVHDLKIEPTLQRVLQASASEFAGSKARSRGASQSKASRAKQLA
jgi:hypothetical protein